MTKFYFIDTIFLFTLFQILKIRAHDHEVNAVSFVDDTSNLLASGGDDDVIRVWDRRTLSDTKPKAVGVFTGHFDGITFIDKKGDGRYLISNSKDQTIKLWDLRCFSAGKKAICESRSLSFSSHWDYRWQAVPRLIKNNSQRMKGDTSIMTYRGHNVRQTLIRCRFSPSHSTGQKYIYSGCATGSVYVYDLLTGSVITCLKSHEQVCRDASWHPYYPEIVSSSWDGGICRWTYADEDHVMQESERKLMEGILDDFPPVERRRSSRLVERAREVASALSRVADVSYGSDLARLVDEL